MNDKDFLEKIEILISELSTLNDILIRTKKVYTYINEIPSNKVIEFINEVESDTEMGGNEVFQIIDRGDKTLVVYKRRHWYGYITDRLNRYAERLNKGEEE